MFATSNNVSILTVTKLNRFAKRVLESEIGLVWVSGEISNFVAASSGHWYFTLKDNGAQVKSAMFKGANQRLSFRPKQGDKVLVRASLSIYEPRGDYQLIVQHMEPEGIGQLKQQFEALKAALSAEGLFAYEHKKPLPEKVKTIGVVTSPTGAAIHDILHVLNRRNPGIKVILYPSLVQGETAAQSIAEQIETANRRNEVDVLIVGRGGGSLEDLWPFNEEIVARAIFASTLPVVSAVGHEVDVTISDFVADERAPTPSAAAELLSQDAKAFSQRIDELRGRLTQITRSQIAKSKQRSQSLINLVGEHKVRRSIAMKTQLLKQIQSRLSQAHPDAKIKRNQEGLNTLVQSLHRSMSANEQRAKHTLATLQQRLKHVSPQQEITQQNKALIQLNQKLTSAMQYQLKTFKSEAASKAALLESVSPLATLSRGYSITFDGQQKVVKSTAQVSNGDSIVTKVADGEITSTVTNTNHAKGT